MQIIREQINKIYHFLIILIILYAVNFVFNIMYDWGGVSVIVRVYIMVLSCYIVYNFSQIDVKATKEEYRKALGIKGLLWVFFIIRILPFAFIYLMTVIFTLINYIGGSLWPYDSLLTLLDGRYSNTVIYSLILFVILRLKIRPGIAIPMFLLIAILYFYFDKLLYNIFDPGMGVSFIKIFKFAIFYFILIYGYSENRLKMFHSFVLSLLSGVFTFAVLVSIFFCVFLFSSPGGKIYSKSARTLLKYGIYQVFRSYEESVIKYNITADITDLIIFSYKSGYNISMTDAQWGDFMLKASMDDIDIILGYMNKKDIKPEFEVIKLVIIINAEKNPEKILKSHNLKRLMAKYYATHSQEFYQMYNYNNIFLKKFIIDSLGYINNYESIIFLIDKLSDVDKSISERAYIALKQATGKDPASNRKKEFYDLDVIAEFRDYAKELRAR